MGKAALALHEATGERSYLDRALAWQRALDRHYANPDNGGYFLTADDAEGLVVRPARDTRRRDAEPECDRRRATWCGSPMLAGDDGWRAQADKLFDGVLSAAGQNLIGHAALLNALDLRLRGAEIVVTGSGARADALLAAARKLSFLDRIVLHASTAEALPAAHPARDRSRPRPTPRSSVSARVACCRSTSRTRSPPPSRRCATELLEEIPRHVHRTGRRIFIVRFDRPETDAR